MKILVEEKEKDLKIQEKAFVYELLKRTEKNKDEELLSEREREVLGEMMTGASNKEIGERLCISVSTVKTHIINIYSKLQVSNRVEAVEKGREFL